MSVQYTLMHNDTATFHNLPTDVCPPTQSTLAVSRSQAGSQCDRRRFTMWHNYCLRDTHTTRDASKRRRQPSISPYASAVVSWTRTNGYCYKRILEKYHNQLSNAANTQHWEKAGNSASDWRDDSIHLSTFLIPSMSLFDVTHKGTDALAPHSYARDRKPVKADNTQQCWTWNPLPRNVRLTTKTPLLCTRKW